MVSVNKHNFTSELINETKEFNVSMLSIHTPFSLIKRFGYQSGKDVDKFVGFRFCMQQRCFEGGSFVGVKAAFL